MQTTAVNFDPRTKLTIVLCLSTLAVFIRDLAFLSGLTLSSLVLLTLLGGSIQGALKRIKRIFWLFIPITLAESLFVASGITLLSLGPLTILTSTGVAKGVEMVLRITAVIVSAGIMTTSNSRDIVQGLVQWRLPYEIAFMVSVAVRFLPMLTTEMKDALIALQLRGIDPHNTTWRKRLSIYAYLFMPVIISTLIRSQKLAIAMEARAFRAYSTRTSYRTLSFAFRDYGVMGASVAVTLGLLYLF